MRDRLRRRRSHGLHLEIGRRYEHSDLTRGQRSSRARRTSALLHKGLDAVQEHYEKQLDGEMMQALHDAVVRLLRPQIRSDWSDDEVADKALEIARQLLEAPLPEA